MAVNREEMKERIAEMVRTLAVGEILTLMSGHLSYRIPGTDEILMPGHGHLHGKTLLDMTGDDIVTIDLEGNLLEGNIQPPGEKFIHTCIYRMRADVGAVIHGHPDISLAFAAAGVEIIPLHIRAIPFAPSVRILDYAGQIDSHETGMMVAEALADRSALMLRGHGVVVVGETPEEACANAFELERNAKIQLHASILGVPKAVTSDQVLRKRPDGQPHKVSSAWNYYRQKYSIPRQGLHAKPD